MTTCMTVIVGSLLACGIEAGEAKTCPTPARGARSVARYVDRVAKTVEASEEQQVQLDKIAAEHDATMAEARANCAELSDEQKAQVGELRRQARKARRSGDTATADELHTQIAAITGNDQQALFKQTKAKIAAVLTPAQLTAFETMADAKESRRGKGRRGRGGREGRGRGFGGPGGLGNGVMIERFVARVIEEVDATEEQQTQLKAITDKHVATMQDARSQAAAAREANRDELRELHEEMRDARKDGDDEEVASIRAEIHTLLGVPNRGAAQQTLFDDLASVMTEEQMPAYTALVDEAKSKLAQRGDRSGKRGKHGRHGGKRGRGFRGRPGPPDDES